MLIGLIILIVCICILLLLINKQTNNQIFHKTTKKYVKNILPRDILISTRPIIKEKLVWVPPPIKYHHIIKHKGHIKEKDNIRKHKLIDNVKDIDFKRIKVLDDKYTGNNLIIDKDFNKDFENNVKRNFGKKYGINPNENSFKPGSSGHSGRNSSGFGRNSVRNSDRNSSRNSVRNSNGFGIHHKEHFKTKSKITTETTLKPSNHPNNHPKIEHFDSYGYGSMIQHPKKNCPKLNMTQCLKFQNCGYITTYDFNNRCVPGDPHGPLDKKIKYQKYYHNDPFTRALIANDNHYRDMSEDVFDIE